MIYFDNAATTLPTNRCIEVVEDTLKNFGGNPSSIYQAGANTKNALNVCRNKVAEIFNCLPSEIYFTSGATEGNNTVLSHFIKNNFPVFTSNIEHKSILNVLNSKDFLVKCDENGIISQKSLENALSTYNFSKENSALVSIIYVNNVIGSTQNIEKLAKTVHKNKCFFHTDATQAIGHLPIDVKKLGVDYLTCSGHKFGAPKGVGILYVKSGSPISPLLKGGGQENNLRSGTENLPYIMAMVDCLIRAEELRERTPTNFSQIKNLNQLLRKGIEKISKTKNINIRVNSNPKYCSNHIFNFSLEGLSGETLVLLLDSYGVCVSSGSACSSRAPEPDYVLQAIGVPENYINGSIRVSFNENNRVFEVEEFLEYLDKSIDLIKGFKK